MSESTSSSISVPYIIDKNYLTEANIGKPDFICVSCDAKLFHGESTKFCCGEGNIQIENLPSLPEYISELLNHSNHFQKNIRKYNNALAMTSLGCKEIYDYLTFKISGRLYHLIGSLVPLPEEHPKYLQIYFLGNTDSAVKIRQSNTDAHLDEGILKQLQDVMHENNAYVCLLKCAYEKAEEINGEVNVIVRNSVIPTVHKGCTNAPTEDEVAVFIAGNMHCHRDIIIQCKLVLFTGVPIMITIIH